MDYQPIQLPETPEGNENENNNNTNDLSSPNPCQPIDENPKKKVFGLDYNNNYYLFSICNIQDKYLSLELIPTDGSLPFSYKIIYNLQILNSIEYIFKDLKTIEECMKRLISLLLKHRITIYRDEPKDLFYIILKVTIIDEDKYIPLKLNCTREVQVCTIRYIYREMNDIKEKFNEYKKTKSEEIERQSKELNELKEKNKKYLKILQKLKNIEDKEYESKLNILNYKMVTLEKDLISHKIKFKCEIIPNHKIIICPALIAQKGFNAEFKVKNIGYSFLSTKYDKIYFDRDIKFSSKEIDFENKKDMNIIINKLFNPNDIIDYNPKLKINNPKEDKIYNFYVNIYSVIHGIISSKPLIIQALIIPPNLKGEELIIHLNKHFEIDLKGNNIYGYDIEGKLIDVKKDAEDYEKKNKANIEVPIENFEDEIEDHINRYIGDKDQIIKNKNKRKSSVIYVHKVKDEVKGFLANNKDVKISETKIRKIIKRLNEEYFASFWLEQKKILEIIAENDGHYKPIAKIVEDLL